jgi:sterol desaturase/sphingolipid hydroxylase (fatty acid hydroxylase superfamily)
LAISTGLFKSQMPRVEYGENTQMREIEIQIGNSGRLVVEIIARHILGLVAILLAISVSAAAKPVVNFNFPGTSSDLSIVNPQNPTATDENATAVSELPAQPRVGINYIEARIKKFALRIFNLDGLGHMIFGLPFWVALIFTLTLERVIPAEPNRKTLSVSFAHDAIWFLYEPVLHAFILATFVSVIEKIYSSHFSYLTFYGLSATPLWVRFVVALLLLDLGYWVQHYINHKVPFLWRLHSIHHSQKELNFFTDFRYHPLEYVVRHTFITIPFLFLSINPPLIVGVAVVKEWYSRFYHGNIRTSLGPLKYILVTPQSHRVHHSMEPRHRDMNFGAIFVFWDFIFRKQYKGFDEYPATGIDDAHFPLPEKVSVKSLFLTPWQQMAHPFSRRSESEPK